MSADHLKVREIEQFLAKPKRSARNTRLVRHLLSECAPCLESVRQAASTPRASYDYGTSFTAAERSLAGFLAEGKPPAASPEELVVELGRLPEEEQIRQVKHDPRFAHPAVIQALIQASHALRFQDPARMLQLAGLALLAADACPVGAAGSEQKQADLRSQARSQYGNALRVLGRFREAEDALATARRYLKAGTHDPRLRARLCSQIASLRMAQRRFSEAIDLNEEAETVYSEIGDDHEIASTLVRKAISLLYGGEAEEAIRTLNRAIPLIEPDRDPHLLLGACHNLVRCYIDLGRPEHALSIYSETRDLYKRSDDPLIRLRAAWQEGLLLRDLGHLKAAETTLLEARQGFVESNLLYEAALVSLDLAAVYVKLQAEEELGQTVAESVPIFKALGVGREALASLLQLQQLSHQSRQALDLLRSLSSRVEKLKPRQTPF